MNFLKKLFGGSQEKPEQDRLVPLLNGIVRPLQHTAVEQIDLALRHIPERDGQGHFMLLLMHVCLASILDRLEGRKVSPTGMSNAFKAFAISQWDQPPSMNVDSAHKMFEYTRQQVGDKLVHSDEDAVADVGLTLLSIALPNHEQFTTDAAIACGQAAQACWRQAALETDKEFGVPLQVDAGTAKIDRLIYLMNYNDHYADILGDHLTHNRLAELFLFRAWTAQFGYRIFSSDPYASEKLIGETVNASKYLGLGMFQQVHGFDVESELGSDFISLIDDRWRDYDVVVSTMPNADRLPTMEIITVLTKHLDVADPVVTYKLSMDFLVQLDLIKRTAMEIGLLGG
jgi:hypothetical protein